MVSVIQDTSSKCEREVNRSLLRLHLCAASLQSRNNHSPLKASK